MLCGYPPFIGRSEDAILDKISFGYIKLNGKLILSSYIIIIGPEWKNVSNDAKIFLKKLLAYNPKERVSAQAALKDSWLSIMTKSNNVPRNQIIRCINNFRFFKVIFIILI
jgi:calcium-dependent protein kinase